MGKGSHKTDNENPQTYLLNCPIKSPEAPFWRLGHRSNYAPTTWITENSEWVLCFSLLCQIPLHILMHCYNICLKVWKLGEHLKCWKGTKQKDQQLIQRAVSTCWVEANILQHTVPHSTAMTGITNWSWHSILDASLLKTGIASYP